jgi:ribosomal protein S18 acetylase RimI-like enzyme
MIEVRRADESDAKAVVATLHAAFFDDPLSTYIFPDPDDRDRLHPEMMRSFVDLALATGEIYATADHAAVAVWFTVGLGDDNKDDDTFVDRTAELCGVYGQRFRAVVETLEHHHPTAEPHYYLQFLATIPDRQSQGLGQRMLRDRFAHIDASGMSAYLESSSARSAALYEREGFTRISPFAFPGGPEAIPMWRAARRVGVADPGPVPVV